MESIWTLKDDPEGVLIQYKINSGEVFTYLLHYSRDLSSSVVEMVDLYVSLGTTPNAVYVTPMVLSMFYKEMYARNRYTVPQSHMGGYETLRIATNSCLVDLIAEPTLKWPIFVGSWEEYNNNDFDEAMEKVLST